MSSLKDCNVVEKNLLELPIAFLNVIYLCAIKLGS